jgi:hypothetical protein
LAAGADGSHRTHTLRTPHPASREESPMRYVYDPFVFRRMAEGRFFFVNGNMPFEYFVLCFQMEKPFFLVSQIEDGRLAIIPNIAFIPWNYKLAEGPLDLLPDEFEYVTMKGTYPVILTAHPLPNIEEWLRKFERKVTPFAKMTLTEFVAACHEFFPLEFKKFERFEKQAVYKEPMTT